MRLRTAFVLGAISVSLLGTAVPARGSGAFSDIDSSPHRSDIVALVGLGVTRGCNPPDNDHFCPRDPITRGQMAAFLHRAFPQAIARSKEERRFVDTDGSEFETDIGWLSATGVTAGCNPPVNDRFCPEDAVTRGEMAAFLVRTQGLKLGLPGFEDVIDSVFEADIAKVAAAGIVRGCDPPRNQNFCPDDPVTREQMATFLVRSMNLDGAVSFSYVGTGGSLSTPYCRNGAVPADPSRVVIVVHGSERAACELVSTIVTAARLEGASSGLVVMAPMFVTQEEAGVSAADLAVWDESGWKSGEFSLGSAVGQDQAVSSFAVVDELVELARSLPSAPSIVVAGHSAGGQFVNRYAGASASEARFLVANPSSYVYLSADRWTGESFETLSDSALADCPSANRWKYGLEDMTGYAASIAPDTFVDRYTQKEVVLLLGDGDTGRDGDLDTGCAAELQGSNRFERGTIYFAHVSALGPAHHTLVAIPAVGHSSYDVFTSPAGRSALFGD
ncbi:MAG: S-layer homology domain-containing protein [Acidimicrobiia bacterium]|nr:S-layer homology domain-containing protein [Acidimicrobiia bacterium]MDH4306433.1 S-layer homology domain-containing protein [Acidimicrobiia bacterium]MDH5292650.1 S-layer homology domain-containing protein [Acidimicrobiia bacterium]